MSWYDGVPATLLYGGPPQNYPAAASAVSTLQSLQAGATGGYSIARIPATFLQQGKIGMIIDGSLSGVITGQATATTAIITVALVSTAANAASYGGTPTVIAATPVQTVTSLSNQPWDLQFSTNVRTVGYGTTSVSTTLSTFGTIDVQTATAGTVQRGVFGPGVVTTIDSSVDQWLAVGVTFSTASATNSCTLEQVVLLGMS